MLLRNVAQSFFEASIAVKCCRCIHISNYYARGGGGNLPVSKLFFARSESISFVLLLCGVIFSGSELLFLLLLCTTYKVNFSPFPGRSRLLLYKILHMRAVVFLQPSLLAFCLHFFPVRKPVFFSPPPQVLCSLREYMIV